MFVSCDICAGQVEAFATGRSLVQGTHTECVCLCVCVFVSDCDLVQQLLCAPIMSR